MATLCQPSPLRSSTAFFFILALLGTAYGAAGLGPEEAKKLQKDAADALGVPVFKLIDLGDRGSLPLVLVPPGSFHHGIGPNRPQAGGCRSRVRDRNNKGYAAFQVGLRVVLREF